MQRLSALAQPLKERTQPISSTAFARVGLMGNPSDGFNGKTISLSIANFWAEVVVIESEKLVCNSRPCRIRISFCMIGTNSGFDSSQDQ